MDYYSGWHEAVPDKTAEIVAQLLLEEIIPKCSTSLQIVTDNGSENINRVMKHTGRNEYLLCNYLLQSHSMSFQDRAIPPYIIRCHVKEGK